MKKIKQISRQARFVLWWSLYKAYDNGFCNEVYNSEMRSTNLELLYELFYGDWGDNHVV